jgi:hypothetical protein
MDTHRGHPIEKRYGTWHYVDTGDLVADHVYRPCGHCKQPNRVDGHDACLGNLPGVRNACCGHGDRESSYIQFDNGARIEQFLTR